MIKSRSDHRRLRRTYLHLSSTEMRLLSDFVMLTQKMGEYSPSARIRLLREKVAAIDYFNYDRASVVEQGRAFGIALHALLMYAPEHEWFPMYWEGCAYSHAREVLIALNPGHDSRPTTYPFRLHEHWMRKIPNQRTA